MYYTKEWSFQYFVSTVYRHLACSGLVIVTGGAVRDRILHKHNMEEYRLLKAQEEAKEGEIPDPVPKNPNDIDCKLIIPSNKDDLPENLAELIEARSKRQYNKLVSYLDGLFGSRNVFSSTQNASYDHVAWTVRTIIVRHVGSNERISIDITSPAPHPNEDAINESEALCMDVNGLYATGEEGLHEIFQDVEDQHFKETLSLHPVLKKLGCSIPMILRAIRIKTFTVVAIQRLRDDPVLWRRVLRRLKDGWTGIFFTFDIPELSSWKFDESIQAVVRTDYQANPMPATVNRFCIAVMDGLDKVREYDEANRLEREIWEAKNLRLQEDGEEQHEEPPPQNLSRPSCCVCMDKIADHIVEGCWHMCMCQGCSEEVMNHQDYDKRRCPMCRNPNVRVQRVFSA